MEGHQRRVLVVEDATDLRELYATWLSPDYDVVSAETLADARRALDDTVDIVLLDRKLPDGRGEELLVDAKDRPCRVGMLTGVEPDFDIIDMGFDAYLVKPVDREDVLDAVAHLLDLRRYEDDVTEYFRVASKKAALETAKPPVELEASEEYQRLCERFEGLAASTVASSTDTQTVRTLFRDLETSV